MLSLLQAMRGFVAAVEKHTELQAAEEQLWKTSVSTIGQNLFEDDVSIRWISATILHFVIHFQYGQVNICWGDQVTVAGCGAYKVTGVFVFLRKSAGGRRQISLNKRTG